MKIAFSLTYQIDYSIIPITRGSSSVVELLPSKQNARVQFPSPAPKPPYIVLLDCIKHYFVDKSTVSRTNFRTNFRTFFLVF